jgi:hypothetical protein
MLQKYYKVDAKHQPEALKTINVSKNRAEKIKMMENTFGKQIKQTNNAANTGKLAPHCYNAVFLPRDYDENKLRPVCPRYLPGGYNTGFLQRSGCQCAN